MERAREIEAHYFRQRREYDAVSACCGVGVLAERLNKVLAKSIRDGLPSVRQALEKALEKNPTDVLKRTNTTFSQRLSQDPNAKPPAKKVYAWQRRKNAKK